MKKLFTWYKNLPPEMRMALALIGLSTPAGIIFFFQRWLKLTATQIAFLLIGLIVVAGLFGFIFSRIFGARKRRRERRLAQDLVSDSGRGPVSMDVAANVKANNEKFMTAVRDMRKNLGVNVYDLPWYIIIGDSGCGKTKMVSESGLTFSTGRPEGYQLGTLNYNWWFTEDAILIDMAGRLCNPRDDADSREWQAFLSTVAKGRPGFPINGAIVCISADHLLQDPPEKIEADANTTLERLRDLQTKLGVTFATYVVVTKCDKIVGFVQFFDRARDITIKNQIFGWSRPGPFNEAYDPEQFTQDFENVYNRLNELRLRRMSEEDEEIDLGLAYTFPEEFRQLVGPLQTYLRTLFPVMRHARVAKNLIFRGVYFTSATQEGALLLRRLAERLGADAADQFAPLDILPHKRSYFIKEAFFKKFFPEYGLVFRNEQQVVRHQKLARTLVVTGGVLFVVLATLLFVTYRAFNRDIGQARADALFREDAGKLVAGASVERCGALREDITRLQGSSWSRKILAWGIGYDRPIRDLTTIKLGLFEEQVLARGLRDVSESLRSGASLADEASASRFMAALEEYVAWAACANADKPCERVTAASFKTMYELVSPGASAATATAPEAAGAAAGSATADNTPSATDDRLAPGPLFAEVDVYFDALKSTGDPRNPARVMPHAEIESTIAAAVDTVRSYLTRYAGGESVLPDDPIVAEWLRIAGACNDLELTYGELLGAAGDEITSLDAFGKLKAAFGQRYPQFKKAREGLGWQLRHPSGQPISQECLVARVPQQRKRWVAYQERLADAYKACGGASRNVEAIIRSLSADSGEGANRKRGLDHIFFDHLQKAGLIKQSLVFVDGVFATDLSKTVDEVPQRFPHILTTAATPETGICAFGVHGDVAAVAGYLDTIHSALESFSPDTATAPETADQWIKQLEAFTDARKPVPKAEIEKLQPFWRADGKLARLYNRHEELILRGGGTHLLNGIVGRIRTVGPWGFAELNADWCHDARSRSAFDLEVPECRTAAAPAAPAPTEPEKPADEPPRRRAPPGSASPTPAPAPAVPEQPAVVPAIGDVVPRCATADYLSVRAKTCVYLLRLLKDFAQTGTYFSDAPATPGQCIADIEAAWARYVDTFAARWRQAYPPKGLNDRLKSVLGTSGPWPSFAAPFARDAGGREVREAIDELRLALTELLRATRWAAYDGRRSWLDLSRTDVDYRNEWSLVHRTTTDAVAKAWGSDSFAVRSSEVRDSTAPWDDAALAVVQAWTSLLAGIGQTAELPNLAEPNPRSVGGIDWGALDRARSEYGLENEVLTSALVDFENRAQRLLSEELTNRLCEQQDQLLDAGAPDGGWPYLRGGPLATVDFGRFREFLARVAKGESAFARIEEKLPSDGLKSQRAGLYAQCAAWRRFLGLDKGPDPAPLQVEIRCSGDMANPQFQGMFEDTAQNQYKTIRLNLGLTSRGTAADAGVTLSLVAPGRQTLTPAEWRWSQQAGEMSVALENPHETSGGQTVARTVTDSVGPWSPLALCAYLQRAIRQNDVFSRVHVFKGVDPRSPEKRYGEILEFRVTPSLPDPIRRLERAR